RRPAQRLLRERLPPALRGARCGISIGLPGLRSHSPTASHNARATWSPRAAHHPQAARAALRVPCDRDETRALEHSESSAISLGSADDFAAALSAGNCEEPVTKPRSRAGSRASRDRSATFPPLLRAAVPPPRDSTQDTSLFDARSAVHLCCSSPPLRLRGYRAGGPLDRQPHLRRRHEGRAQR